MYKPENMLPAISRMTSKIYVEASSTLLLIKENERYTEKIGKKSENIHLQMRRKSN